MWIKIIIICIYSLFSFERTVSCKGLMCSVGYRNTSLDKWKHCMKEERCQCLTIQKEQVLVSCSNLKLEYVPTLLPKETISLDLSYNLIKSLKQRKFRNYKHLKNLNLAHNQLTTIQQGAFDGLQQLDCLSLMNNSIRYNEEGFTNGSFRHLKNLRKLNIQQHFTDTDFGNEDYSFKALIELKQLETLYLDGIPNRTLGNVFQNMKQLKALVFNGQTGRCYLPRLARHFFPHNTKLMNVTINRCGLEAIQSKTFESLTNLRCLDLSYNTRLTFTNLINITNGLDKTNIEIIKLNNIHKTTGSCARITAEQAFGFKNLSLKEIYFESNRLTSLERGAVYHLPVSLKTISLRDNAIMQDAYILEALVYLPKLVNLENIILADQFQNRYFDLPIKANDNRDLKPDKNRTSDRQYDFAHTTNTIPVFTAKENYFQSESSLKPSLHAIAKEIATQKPLKSDISGRIKRHSDTSENIVSIANKLQNKMETKSYIKNKETWCSIVIPASLRYVDASNMKIRMAIPSCVIDPTNNLQKLNLSLNMYFEWNASSRGLENLTVLDLSWNSCSRMHLNFFKNMPSLKYLNLSRNFLGSSLNADTNGTTFESQHQLLDLDLSANDLVSLPETVLKGLDGLEVLDLSANRLKDIRVDFSHMRKLWKLDLSDNKLETVGKSLRDYFDRQGNFNLNLENNPLKCDCGHTDFVKWMTDSKVSLVRRDLYVCKFGNESRNLSTVGARTLHEELKKKCYNYTPFIIVGTTAITLVLAIIGGTVTYQNRWNLRYMYYFAKYKARGNKERNGEYEAIGANENEHMDVNVSYADEDSEFVIQKIYKELEMTRGMKLYIRDRNAEVGKFICDNIFDAIENTKKTLIIMSEAYLRHKWCVFEMNMVGIKALKSDSDLVCVLMLENVPQRQLPLKLLRVIKDQEFLEYPGDGNLHDTFWDRLRDLCTA